jgi:serine/threonine protein kinase
MCDSPQLVPTLQELETSDSSLIGKGTFGIVKVAKSRKTNKKYALKIVRKTSVITKLNCPFEN